MHILLNIIKMTGVLLTLLVIGLYFYLQHIKPVYKGKLEISGLSAGVEVWFDDYGIPHIYAQNKEDLFRALGYVHAQERMWQMELVRRIAPGRLSEILGKDLLETDKFFRTLGIHQSSKQAAEQLKKIGPESPDYPVLLQTEAYLAGINEYVKNGPTPLEYSLLGIEKTDFTLEDVYNAVGYMSFSFAAAHKTDPLVQHISQQLGPQYLKDLGIEGDSTREMIPAYRERNEENMALSSNILRILGRLPVSPFIGSNSWVIGPAKTKSGKVIFANDPHIGFSQPAVWYEAYLETPDFELYGYYLAGYPFAILGHNRKMAVGFTMLENDDIDFFAETVHETDSAKYRFQNEWMPFETRQEVIEVRGESPVTIEVKLTHHGPIVNDVLGERAGTNPVAMWWLFTHMNSELLQATYQLNNAQSIEDVSAAAALIHAPGLNVMYGDANGNIGWWSGAKLVKRPKHVNSFTYLDGAGGNDEPLAYYHFSENPHSVNPPSSYVYSANNQPDSIDGYLYPGYYMPEDRAKRIRSLLESSGQWDKEMVKKMLMDEQSPVAINIRSVLTSQVQTSGLDATGKEALNVMQNWDGTFEGNSPAPTIYAQWVYKVLELAMKDELDSIYFELFMSTDLRKKTLALLVDNDSSVWWDVRTTRDIVEKRESIAHEAFVATIKLLEHKSGSDIKEWTWRDVHTLQHNHALGVVPLLGKVLNVGPFGVSAGEEVINNLGYPMKGNGLYEVSYGPSTRRVIDFSDVESSESILPTGQSGVISSRHYDDQAGMFVDGSFRKMLMNKKELAATGRLLRLLPKAE